VVDVGPDVLTIEVTGPPAKINAMLEMLDRYGIREIVQSGVVALDRGPPRDVGPCQPARRPDR
jgi:acetolactate synthase-1/3 small subunit